MAHRGVVPGRSLVDAIVTECPIDQFEWIGRRLNEPHLAHRARSAYDALRAFVRRDDPERVERDVIARERIEGVDARAWIRRRGPSRTSRTTFERTLPRLMSGCPLSANVTVTANPSLAEIEDVSRPRG